MRDRVDDPDFLLQRELERALQERHPGPLRAALHDGHLHADPVLPWRWSAARSSARSWSRPPAGKDSLDAIDWRRHRCGGAGAPGPAGGCRLMAASFLFYDLETFGSDPRRTRIAQFAAIRTDADLELIDEPVSFFVQAGRRPAALARRHPDHRHHPAARLARRRQRSRSLRAHRRGNVAARKPARWATTRCASTTSSCATACSAISTTPTSANGAAAIRAGTCST